MSYALRNLPQSETVVTKPAFPVLYQAMRQVTMALIVDGAKFDPQQRPFYLAWLTEVA